MNKSVIKLDYPGLFIVFEGLDGSGKTTQIDKLVPYLKTKKYHVANFYEPTHGKFGTELRDLFKVGHIIPIKDEIELSLKDRREDVEQNIVPALLQGKIVILDRYYWSNVAYQGTVDPNYSLDYILEKSKEFPEPNVIIYFDIDVEVAIKRISVKRKPNEYESLDYLNRSKEMYDKLIKTIPKSFRGKFFSISVNKNENHIFNELKVIFTILINEWNA